MRGYQWIALKMVIKVSDGPILYLEETCPISELLPYLRKYLPPHGILAVDALHPNVMDLVRLHSIIILQIYKTFSIIVNKV